MERDSDIVGIVYFVVWQSALSGVSSMRLRILPVALWIIYYFIVAFFLGLTLSGLIT